MSFPSQPIRRRLWLLSALATTLFSGCFSSDTKSKPKVEQAEVNAKDRPPLEILLVDAEFDQELRLHWQAFSEQPIQIRKVSSSELAGRALDTTDVWIFPTTLMGDMIASERIIPLTAAAAGAPYEAEDLHPLGNSLSPENPNGDAEPEGTSPRATQPKSTVDSWPTRWKSASRFGSTSYAVPLGSSQLVLMGLKIDTAPLDILDDPSTPQEDRTGLASNAWKSLIGSLPEGKIPADELAGLIKGLSPQQADAVVDRFLWIAATTNAKRRGLFDMTKLQPRLGTDEFVLAAEVLSELVRRSPATMLATHAEAWDLINARQDPKACIAIAMPGLASIRARGGDSTPDADTPLHSSKLATNPFQGLVASIGKRTRQTSVAAQFTAWLSEPSQREVLARVSDSVELWPAQPNPLLNNEVLRTYHNLNNREQRTESLLLSTRFAHASSYRQALAKALGASILSPDQSHEHLENCVLEWNAITESLGILNQRKNVEQAMGFGS